MSKWKILSGAGPRSEPDLWIVPGQRDNKNAPLSLSEPSSRRFSIKRSLVISSGIKRRTADTMARIESAEKEEARLEPR